MRFSRYISGIHAVIAWLLCPTYRSRELRASEEIKFVTGLPNSAHFCPFALRYIFVPRCDQAFNVDVKQETWADMVTREVYTHVQCRPPH